MTFRNHSYIIDYSAPTTENKGILSMKPTPLFVLLAVFAPLSACADDATESNDVESTPAAEVVTSKTADHPPIYDPNVHDSKIVPEPELTYGEFIELFSDIDPAEFYAKNPEWVSFKDKKMTSEKVVLGVID